ncbi:hypothetical protein IFR05_016968 [Cadophora sp. M221]|nr:hypothetical protein IFR05_016968 [Cadophora sp. M221]
MGQTFGISSILESAFPPQNLGNISSDDPVPRLSPTTILEAFVPGYGPIHKFVLFTFGFDVTIVVSYNINSSRRLMAETPTQSAWDLDSKDVETPQPAVDSEGNIKWLNFSNQEAKCQPRFTPAIGSHNFWYKGTYFQLRRKEVSLFDELGNGAAAFKDKEFLTLSCFGRSTQPIKKLIQRAKEYYYLGHNAKTVIKRPASKDMRRFGGRGSWLKIAERPCRPMKTVVLDEEQKTDVLSDINEYLNPATARWYANRGIPYRRGYLFYGPPGTGKTSLTFALAGVFGLDIHVVSLLEPTLTEEELGMLFANLPARCIVLLEDIDTAGLIREPTDADEKDATSAASDPASNEWNVMNLTKALKKANQLSEEEKKKGISLSGLLNIIDGVASHEGRVLVMTTNHPEKLDEALIRPGRIDHQVAFSNATGSQIRELFKRTYSNDLLRTNKIIISPPAPALSSLQTSSVHNPACAPAKNKTSQNNNAIDDALDSVAKEEEIGEEELSSLAEKFAKEMEDDIFSPAEIQGFLLKRKKDPRRAVEEVEQWVKGMVEIKKKGSKLVKVQ